MNEPSSDATTVSEIPPSTPAARELAEPPASRVSALKPHYDNSWAIVIGINRYQADGIRDLDYGVSDADGIARLLVTQLGFTAESVFVVLDPPPPEQLPYRLHAEHAAKAVIEDLLFTRLPELVGPDDRLLFFFAGHGECRRLPVGAQEIGYLVPSDAEPGHWHTYIDLDAVTRAGNLCAAKHVFYLLDACYSGLATARAEVRERRYEEDMLTNRARQALTAGNAKQAVADKGPQGHSLFTWYVLQGLRGEADLFHNGVITGNELMVYVRDQVARAFGSEQTPDFGPLPGHESGGDFVFVEPGFSAQEHFDLGCALMELGRQLVDPGRFLAAAEQFDTAQRLSGRSWGEAWRKLGEAQFAAGEIETAVASFDMARNQGDSQALLHLGLAYAKQRHYDEAIDALKAFAELNPDHVDVSWARDFAVTLRRTGGGRRYALLIGTGMGAAEDLRELREVLVRRLGFRGQDIVLLTDEQATSEAIRASFAQLAARTREADTVLACFTGVGTQIPNRDSHYQTRDGLLFVFLPEDYRKEVLREDQVFELMSRIPARDKLLIADVPHFAFETGRSRSLGFRFIGGCRRNELTFTKDIDGKQRGVFTYHLIRHIDQEDDRRLTYGDLLGRVTASLNAAGFSHTHPVHVGARKTPVFPRHEPDYLWLYELSCGRDCAALTDGEMAMWRQMLEDSPITTSPEANMALARALAARGAFDPALEAVRRASSGGLEKVAEPLLLQLRTLIRARRYHEAATFVERLGARASDPCLASLPQATHGLLAILDRGEKHALLVGIGSYASADLLRAKDAPDDVAGLRDELVTRWGFQPGNIVVLTDAQASREAILDELRRLAELARDKPTLFYFSGLGSVDADGEPVLLGADARQAEIQDIPISMLHEIAAPIRRNLVTLIDAGFSVESKDPRFVDPAPGSGFLYWGHGGQIARRMSDHHGIGGLSVFPASMRYIRRGQERSQSGKAHGSTSKRATRLFLDALRAGEMPTVSRAELRARLVASGLTVLGAASDEPLFANLNVVARVEAALDGIEGRPLMVARDLLTKLLQCRGGADPRLLLELGVALHVLTLRDSARRALEDAARMLHSKDAVSNRDMRARADAHYYLGYVLLAEGQYSNAVSHFELVLAESPGHAKAHYYRGLALQKLIELDLFRQIEESWKTYLKLGAPIGHAREVTDFLDRRQAQTSDS